MTVFKKALGKLQTHITTVFSLLLFLSFAMVGLAFNLAVNRYVARSAAAALEEAHAHFEARYARSPGVFLRIFRGNHRFLHGDVGFLMITGDYELPDLWHWPEAQQIAAQIAQSQLRLAPTESTRLRAAGRTYYISIHPAAPGTVFYGWHEVLFLDVTDILLFTAVVNRLMLVLVAFIWLISMIIAAFLTDSMVRPLRILRDFVRQIGRGDFSQSARSFANEEFEELNQSLNHAARQLARYDNDQKTFFQNVSHELRTPLMSIKSYAEGIKYKIMEPAAASATILEAADRLAEMVDDILYVSRIDNLTAPAMETANLCAIIEERIRGQQHVAQKRGVIIDFISDGEPIFILCAAEYIERAADNLISNAVRYARGIITIECYAIGSRAIIRVTDDGPGFEPDALPRVFERFYRGKNGLTGIGLSMVKSIIDQHKGTATAENGKEKGAILTISLPRPK